MGYDAFAGSNKKPNFKLHLIIFVTIVGVSVFLSTQVEKSKNNTRIEALKVPVPIDSVFVNENAQQSSSKTAKTTTIAPGIKDTESEYRFDSGPNLAAIDKLLAKHDETTTDALAEVSIAHAAETDTSISQNSDIEFLAQESDTAKGSFEREKDIAIMVTDEEVVQTDTEVTKATLTSKIEKIASKKIGKLDTVYELQQDRFLETLAKTANTEAEESLEVKRMKEAMRADRPLTIKSTVKSANNMDAASDTTLVKVVATDTAGVLEQNKTSATNSTRKITVAKKTASVNLPKQKSATETALNEIALTKSELNNVLSLFMRSYNKGDIQRLMALFDENAKTNDQNGKQGIQSEYLELFKTTSDRDIKIKNIQWDLGKGKARGDAKFTVTVKPVGSAQAAQVEGKLKILAVKESKGVFIKSLLHEVTVR